MAPRSENDFKNIRDLRKAAILDAAMELFAEKGFQGTSISLLAKKVGISKGLIYNYFTNKEALVMEVVEEGMMKMFKNFTIPEGNFNDEDMDRFINQNFDLLDASPRYWQLYFSVIMQPSITSLVMESIMKIIMPLMDKLSGFFQEKGIREFEKEAYFIGSLLDGISLNYLYNKETYPRDYAIGRIKEIININTTSI